MFRSLKIKYNFFLGCEGYLSYFLKEGNGSELKGGNNYFFKVLIFFVGFWFFDFNGFFLWMCFVIIYIIFNWLYFLFFIFVYK